MGSSLPAPSFRLGTADIADSAALARAMPRLAREVRASYRATDSAVFLDNTFRLQLVEGDYAGAATSIAALRAWRAANADTTPRARGSNVQYEIYAKAMARRSDGGFAGVPLRIEWFASSFIDLPVRR
jgi:hypothetical protein